MFLGLAFSLPFITFIKYQKQKSNKTMRKSIHLFLAMTAFLLCSCTSQPTNTANAETTAADSATTENIVTETILARRSIRQYKAQPVEKEKMDEIIKCGVYAPNGMGRESWEVRVVDDAALLAEIDSCNSAMLAKTNPDKAKMKAAYGAPVLVFIAYDTRYDLSQVDCGLLGGNMMIAAQSLGLGSCCLGSICRLLNAPEGSDLLKRLNFPETHKLLYAIAFGYPDEAPKAKPRHMEKVQYIK